MPIWRSPNRADECQHAPTAPRFPAVLAPHAGHRFGVGGRHGAVLRQGALRFTPTPYTTQPPLLHKLLQRHAEIREGNATRATRDFLVLLSLVRWKQRSAGVLLPFVSGWSILDR
jgi:hypothetical protein